MKYYKLSESFEKGNSAIIEGFDENYLESDKLLQGELGYFEFPNNQVFFSGLQFKKGAVLVDFINTWGAYGGLGYLISEKAKFILEKFCLPTHKFYEIPKLEFNGSSYQYFYMQILTSSFDYSFVDFSKSIFFKTDFFKENKEVIKFYNSAELKDFFENIDDTEVGLGFDKLYLNKTYQSSNLDMFYLDNLVHPFIINEEIHNEFRKQNITGIILEELPIFE